jgi:nitrite reductase/ring-hydroxylating ferredoxin subunit
MPHLLKIADPDELPPGKGKTIHVEGRDVTVYNREGRYVATGTWPRHLHGVAESTCEMPGHRFEVGIGDSPDRLSADELRYQVHVEGDGVYILVEEGHVHPGEEPRAKRRRGRAKKA